MAGSVNKVILVGNLGKDPEIRRTQDGRPIANLSIATSETWRDKGTGERKEKTEWHRVVIFSEAAVQDRRAVPEEGRQGLHRGRAADPQMDRPVRRREVLDRGRAAGLQLDPDHAGRPQWRRWRQLWRGRFRRRFWRRAGQFGATPRGCGRRRRRWAQQQRYGRRYPVLSRPRSRRLSSNTGAPLGAPVRLWAVICRQEGEAQTQPRTAPKSVLREGSARPVAEPGKSMKKRRENQPGQGASGWLFDPRCAI